MGKHFNDTSTAERRHGMDFLRQQLADHDRRNGRIPNTRAIEKTAQRIAEKAERDSKR